MTKFNLGESILGYHGPLLYIAKVLQVDVSGDKEMYFIHYQKWSKKWDEWVGTDRLLKDDDANRKYKQQLENENSRQKKNKKKKSAKGGKRKGSSTESTKAQTGERKTKRRKGAKDKENEEPVDETIVEDMRTSKQQIKIKIPGSLKKKLIADWEFVTRNRQIVDLPRKPSVTTMLDDFKTCKKRTQKDQKAVEEVIRGLKQFFNRALGLVLLYTFERPQYEELIKQKKGKKKEMTDIYGAEHFLRLFVKLPALLSHTDLNKQEVSQIQNKVKEFITWMEKNGSKYFSEQYKATDAEYHGKVSHTIV